MSWNVHRKLQREREVGKWRTLNYSDINIISLGCSVDLPSVSGSTENFIRFWNVLIYCFVSLKSLKALGRAALCDTNRFNVCTLYPRDYSSCRTCADVWPLYSSNRTSKPGSIIIRWLGMSPRSSPRDLLGKIEDENRENDGNRAHLNLQQTALKSSKNLNALNCGVSSIQCFWAKEI